jgi:hypothetical protein
MRLLLPIALVVFHLAGPARADPGWNRRGVRGDARVEAEKLIKAGGLYRVIHGRRFSKDPVAVDAERRVPGLKQVALDLRRAIVTLAKASTHARVLDIPRGKGEPHHLVNFMAGGQRIGYLALIVNREVKRPEKGLVQRTTDWQISFEDRTQPNSRGQSGSFHLFDERERFPGSNTGDLVVNALIHRGEAYDLLHERHEWRREQGRRSWKPTVTGSATRSPSHSGTKYTRTVPGSSSK